MQRSILSKLDNMERGLSATEAIHTRITQMGREMEDLKEKLQGVGATISELQRTVGECKGKISESAEKLETVRAGLSDFATDMNTLVHSVGSAESSPQEGAAGHDDSPSSPEDDKVGGLHYFDNQGLALDFD
ncbi:hypothetical protein F4679DRAFT_221812 [Xylaria curta]|nr:hypothetical protein F4679DRAFT_221812 [Xylaria curta]